MPGLTLPLLVLCYAQDDVALVNSLKTFLSPAEHPSVELWDSSQIPPGDDRARALASKIERADLVVVLLSAALFADEAELQLAKRAMERHRNRLCRVFPVRLRPCVLLPPFEEVQVLPKSGVSVVESPSHDAVWLEITTDLRRAAREVQESRATPTAAAPDEESPSVLVAGPFFGFSAEERLAFTMAWPSAPVKAVEDLRKNLDRRDTSAAHMAALLRFDTIIDLSPWAAFSRWSSTGCLVASLERTIPAEVDGPVVLTVGDRERPTSSALTAPITSRLFNYLAKAKDRLSVAIAVAGFDSATVEGPAELIASLDGVRLIHVPPEEEDFLRACPTGNAADS